jgi:hypothetical protein
MASLYLQTSRTALNADPFIDLLFNFLLGFAFLFLVALLYINPEAKEANIEKQAEYIISATWPEHLKDDIDLWVRGPDDQTVSYLNKEVGWLHLDRDDRGEINDVIVIDGVEKIHPINQEIITIRKKHSGEYIVNLYYYDADSEKPLPVKLRIDRVNPRFQTVYQDTIVLNGVDDEQTAVRFSIDEKGGAERFSRLPATLTPYALEHSPAWAN